jgi:hypothetical protein
MGMPEIGETVVTMGRKGPKYGEVISQRDDGMYRHFVVEYSADMRVEYPESRWYDTVEPVQCV